MKNWPCMSRVIEASYKYYTVCWTNNYCCKRKYKLASETGFKPWSILDSIILSSISHCHGDGLDCLSNTNCKICVCEVNATEPVPALLVNDLNEKLNNKTIIEAKYHSFNSLLEIIDQSTGYSYIYIYDIIGRLIYASNFEKNSIIYQIYIPNSIQKGIYYYKININNKIFIGNYIKY